MDTDMFKAKSAQLFKTSDMFKANKADMEEMSTAQIRMFYSISAHVEKLTEHLIKITEHIQSLEHDVMKHDREDRWLTSHLQLNTRVTEELQEVHQRIDRIDYTLQTAGIVKGDK